MGERHIHAEYIKAWAEGKDIQYSQCGKYWADDPDPHWKAVFYRIKPEPKYPETKFTDEEFMEMWRCHSEGLLKFYHVLSNKAIRRAIEDGDVILPESKGT